MLKSKEFSNTANVVTFGSGILQVLERTRDKIVGVKGHPSYFGDRTVGYGRYYSAQEAGLSISRLVMVPFGFFCAQGDLVELKDFRTGSVKIYSISQVQESFSSAPACTLLTLSEVTAKYADTRADGYLD